MLFEVLHNRKDYIIYEILIGFFESFFKFEDDNFGIF